MIDFDAFHDWRQVLDSRFGKQALADLRSRFATKPPDYIEDAGDTLVRKVGRDTTINTIASWILSDTLVGYHGTRLMPEDVCSIRTHGLLPLSGGSREGRLRQALSQHRSWNDDLELRLKAEIDAVGAKQKCGPRDGQVHLTLSGRSLGADFNHYLRYGAEFDYHVAQNLFGKEGLALLEKVGAAYMVRVAVPGRSALEAAHWPSKKFDDFPEACGLPNIIRELVNDYAFYGLAHPRKERESHVDCGMVFTRDIPADWIVGIDQADLPA